MDFNLLVLTSFEITTTTTMDSQEPACCYNSHFLAWLLNEVGANIQLPYKARFGGVSRENWSYPKVVPRTDFGCQKWSPRTTFGCQKWSHLAKTGPSRTKFGNQNRSGRPSLAAESGPPDQFGLLRVVLLPYSDC